MGEFLVGVVARCLLEDGAEFGGPVLYVYAGHCEGVREWVWEGRRRVVNVFLLLLSCTRLDMRLRSHKGRRVKRERGMILRTSGVACAKTFIE